MADSDPIIDGNPEPPASSDKGALLFDPTAPISLDELDGYHGGGPESGSGRSRTPLVLFGLLAIGAVTAVGIVLAGAPPASEDVSPIPPVVDSVMPGSTVAETISPIPTSEVRGAIETSVRLAVRAVGRGGVAMADTLVRFSIDTGAGSLAETLVRANADGVAATSLLLPSQPGRIVVLAHVMGSEIRPGRFDVLATPGVPASIEIVSGNQQEAEVGSLLATRVFIALEDAAGNPVPNSEIRFEVITGDGITAPSRTRTDSTGRASALWRLGMVEGTQRLTAIASDILEQVTFTATALAPTNAGVSGPVPLESAPVRVRPQVYAVGGSHACWVSGGGLACRGGNDRGQTGGTGNTGFVAVAAGAAHSCGLDDSGQALCWGANEGGQLGDGSRVDKSRPTAVRTDLRFSALAAGESHTCGLAGGGVPLCWGLNLSGQLGDGTRNDQTVPRTVGGGLEFRTIAVGWSHTCGLTANGNAFCWGLNSQGQLGDGSTLDRLLPTLVPGALETLAAGSAHTCGIGRGQVQCWGGNAFGQLGDGTTDSRGQPAPVQGLPSGPTELAAGAVHACALVQGGRAYCWGQNLSGQLGDGTTQNRLSAVPVEGGLSFTEIHAGGAQTCARTADGTWYCWGLNQSGQLGDGTRASRSVPTRVTG